MKDMPTSPQPASQAAPRPRRRWLAAWRKVLAAHPGQALACLPPLCIEPGATRRLSRASLPIQATLSLASISARRIRDTRWLPSGLSRAVQPASRRSKGCADVSNRARQLEGPGSSRLPTPSSSMVRRDSRSIPLPGGAADAPSWSPPGGGEGKRRATTASHRPRLSWKCRKDRRE